MLCPLHLKFDTNKLQVKSQSDSEGPMVEFVSTEGNVFFKKVADKLVSMYIRNAIHNQGFDYECVFVHQNTVISSQRLYIFVPLSESTSVGLSYSFFSKFPTHNVGNTVSIPVDENLNPAHTYPTQKEFYWYHSDFDPITNTSVPGGEFIRIVFTHSTNIHSDVLGNRKHGGGGDGGDDITPNKLFKNNGSTVSYEGVTQQSIITKCYPTYQTDGVKLTKDTEDDDDDSDDGDDGGDEETGELEADIGEEDKNGRRMLVFLAGFVGVILILGFFKAGAIFNFERLHYIGKFIGLFIWLPYHINYIYFSRFFISILLGICLGFASLINVFWENSYPGIFKGALKEGIYNRPEYPITAVLTIIWAISSRTQMKFYDLPAMRHIPKDSICRNNVRYIGGTQIDPCYRESDMRKYITNPNDRKKFIDEFKQARKTGKNAENSVKIAAASLGEDFIDIHRNYTKPHMMNGVEIGKWEYLFCDLWNNMFSKKNNRKNCTSFTETRQSSSGMESSETCSMTLRSHGSTGTSFVTINGGGTKFLWNLYDCIRFSDNIDDILSSDLRSNIPNKGSIGNVLDKDVVSLKSVSSEYEIEGILFEDNLSLVFCPLLKTHKFVTLSQDFILTFNPELKHPFKLGAESEYKDSLPLFAGRQTIDGDYSNVVGTWNLPDSYGRQYIAELNGDPILPYEVLLYKRDHPVVTFSVKGFEKSLKGYIFKEDNHIHFLFNEDSKCLLNASRNKELRIIGIETFHEDQVYSGIPFFSGNFNRVLKLESPARDYGFTQEINALKSENDTFNEYLSDFDFSRNSPNSLLQNRLNDYYDKSMVDVIPTFESIFDGPVVRFISLKKKRGIKCFLFQEDNCIYTALGDQGRVIKKRNKNKKKTKKKLKFQPSRRFDTGEGLVIKVLHYSPNEFKYNSSNKTISALVFDDSINDESITEDGFTYSDLSGRKEYTELTSDWLKPNHNAGNIYLKLLKQANKFNPTLSVTLCDKGGNEHLGYIKDNGGILIFESTSGGEPMSNVEYRIKMFESTGWDDVDQFRKRVYMIMINLLEI